MASILEAAARVLEREGFAGFNTNAIAALAGVGAGSLYQYFPDKESILRALVVQEVEERVGRAIAAMSTHSGHGAVIAGVTAALAHAQQRPVLTMQLALAEPSILTDKHDRAVAGPLIAALAAAITMDHGVPAEKAEALAHDVIGICKGLIMSAAARNDIGAAALIERVSVAVRSYLDAAAGA